jgi:proliferating cell nuclear antigen PCNA
MKIEKGFKITKYIIDNCTMNIELNNEQKLSQFACIAKNLKSFSSDIELIVDQNKLYAQGMDSGHVCLFELVLKGTWFNSYNVDKSYSLGINCELLSRVLECLESKHTIKIHYNDNSDYLEISLLPKENESGMVKIFRLPLIDLETNLLEIPETEYSADVYMISEQFSKLVHQMSIFGKHLRFEMNENIKISTKGDMGSMDAVIKQEDINMYACEEDMSLNLAFSGQYINMMTAFTRLNKQIKIHFSEDIPMKMQYGLDSFMDTDDEDSSESDENYLRLFLAPKVEED